MKKKPTTTDRNRSKAAKEPQTTSTNTSAIQTESPAAAVRGGRGRARGGDRGGRGGRGGRAGAHTNGTRGAEKPAPVVAAAPPATTAATAATTSATPATTGGKTTWSAIAEGTAAKTEQSTGGQTTTTTTTAPTAAAPAVSASAPAAPSAPAPAPEPVDGTPKESAAAPKTTSVIPEGTKKGWASLFAKPAPPPPQPKPAVAPAPPAAEPAPEKKAPEPQQQQQEQQQQQQQKTEPTPAPPAATAPAPIERAPEPVIPKAAPPPIAEAPGSTPATTSTNVTPAKDDLTKTNLEQIPDASQSVPTATVASNVGSVVDPSSATPSRGTPSSYAANAARQSGGGRAPGFQRRVMEQQEAVVMPGNHAVDRAAVQFGSMGLNGDAAGPGADQVVDDTRGEQAETRAQPPQHSPVAPRASLPPSSAQHQQHQPQVMPSEMAAPTVARPAPGLPPVPQVNAADNSFADFARYTEAQKPYDPFSQQVSQPQPQPQEPFANQAPIQPAGSATTTTAASEYSPFYAVDQRLPYNYYGAYGQSQDANVAQRAAAGFGGVSGGAEVQQPQIPTTTAAQPPSRYGHVDAAAAAAPNSGHTTPNPTLPGAAASQTPTAAQHMPNQTAAAAAAAAHTYGYGYPYYTNPHYATYMSQMNQQHQFGRNRPMYDDARRYDDHYMQHNTQYGYGNQYGPYGKAAGMYGQPHAAAFSYDHASSPAAASFSQAMPGRDSVYGRTGSAQPSEAQQTAAAAAAAAGGANAFGGGMDVFGRTPAGFGQSQPISQQPPVSAEETKSFDTPKAGGPSPSLAQANRPGSATNNVPGQPQAQTGLPPLQAQQQGQQGFGAYPHLNPQYGSLGALGGHQAANHQAAAGYGGYGGGFANYYGNTGRGWGGNYGH